jgi:hypothetical protein
LGRVARLLLGILKPDDIVWTFAVIKSLLFRGNYIVRRADHCAEIADSCQVIAKTTKWLGICHKMSISIRLAEGQCVGPPKV